MHLLCANNPLVLPSVCTRIVVTNRVVVVSDCLCLVFDNATLYEKSIICTLVDDDGNGAAASRCC